MSKYLVRVVFKSSWEAHAYLKKYAPRIGVWSNTDQCWYELLPTLENLAGLEIPNSIFGYDGRELRYYALCLSVEITRKGRRQREGVVITMPRYPNVKYWTGNGNQQLHEVREVPAHHYDFKKTTQARREELLAYWELQEKEPV